MNAITLRRTKSPPFKPDDDKKPVPMYVVEKVVGAVSPYVGEKITLDHARDLCDQTGTWTVTFI